MSREKELAKNTLILSIGTFLPKFTALVTLPIITGTLTKNEYGLYELLGTLVALVLPIDTLQIQSAAFRFLIEYREQEDFKKSIITNIYCFIIPISVLSLIILNFSLYRIETSTKYLVLLYFFVDVLIVSTQQIVRGLSKNKLYSFSAVVQSFINMALIVLTVSYGCLGLNGVLLSFMIATIISIAILGINSGAFKYFDFKFFSIKLLKEMLSYSWPMIPNTLSSWVLTASDRFVLSSFIGIESVAVYGAGNRIPQLFSSVQGTFIFAWQENASLALSDTDVEKYYSDMFDRIFCILTGIMAGLIGSTPILFLLLIKGDYADAYPQMPILFMGMFFSALSSFLGGIYVAHKRTKNVGVTTMLAAACNLIIDLVWVKSIGIYAASLSTLVSYMLLAVYRMQDIKKFQKITYNYFKVISCLLVLVGMCVLCWINTHSLNITNLVFGLAFAILLNKKLVKGIIKSIRNRALKGPL